MAPNLVLITGATGHVGFCTLLLCLRAGYDVRCAVRSSAKANVILSNPQIQCLNPGPQLSFVLVPDLTAPGAYDTAVEGVSFIIHIASPLTATMEIPMNEHDAYFIQPAVRGTLSMLEAAHHTTTVQRIVITSSLVALVPLEQLLGNEPRLHPVLPTDRIPFPEGPYEDDFAAYAASKVAALAEAEAWMESHRPAFDVVYLHPSFIEGRNELALTPREILKGTNGLVLGIALGKTFPAGMAGATVLTQDVGMAHVTALQSRVPGNRSYILSQPTWWSEVRNIVEREFPEAVEKHVLNCAEAETHWLEVDADETETVFGFRHAGFEEQVKSVVGHYLELWARRRRRDVRANGDQVEKSKIERFQSVRAF